MLIQYKVEIIYIVTGWFLGIFSPLIATRISRRGEKNSLKKIIFNDLKDLKKRITPISYLVLPKYGKLDEETFQWLKENLEVDFTKEIKKVSENGASPKELLMFINQRGLQSNSHSNFKKIHLFATDSRFVNLHLLDDSLIEKVLEIRFHVAAFNEEIDGFREHFKMTFLPGITEVNHRILSQEIENASLDIAKKSRYIVNKINNVLEN